MALYSNGNKVGIGSLAGMSDVDLTNPTDGQLLKYNGTSGEWENAGINADEVSPKLVLSIPANTYNTYALALAALETAFDALSDDMKLKTCIMVGNEKYDYVGNAKVFNWSMSDATKVFYYTMNLTSHWLKGTEISSSISRSDLSNNAQTVKLDLYII